MTKDKLLFCADKFFQMKPYPKELTKLARELVEANPTRFSTSVVENMGVLDEIFDSKHFGSERTRNALARIIALILKSEAIHPHSTRGKRTIARKKAKIRTKKHL